MFYIYEGFEKLVFEYGTRVSGGVFFNLSVRGLNGKPKNLELVLSPPTIFFSENLGEAGAKPLNQCYASAIALRYFFESGLTRQHFLNKNFCVLFCGPQFWLTKRLSEVRAIARIWVIRGRVSRIAAVIRGEAKAEPDRKGA